MFWGALEDSPFMIIWGDGDNFASFTHEAKMMDNPLFVLTDSVVSPHYSSNESYIFFDERHKTSTELAKYLRAFHDEVIAGARDPISDMISKRLTMDACVLDFTHFLMERLVSPALVRDFKYEESR